LQYFSSSGPAFPFNLLVLCSTAVVSRPRAFFSSPPQFCNLFRGPPSSPYALQPPVLSRDPLWIEPHPLDFFPLVLSLRIVCGRCPPPHCVGRDFFFFFFFFFDAGVFTSYTWSFFSKASMRLLFLLVILPFAFSPRTDTAFSPLPGIGPFFLRAFGEHGRLLFPDLRPLLRVPKRPFFFLQDETNLSCAFPSPQPKLSFCCRTAFRVLSLYLPWER